MCGAAPGVRYRATVGTREAKKLDKQRRIEAAGIEEFLRHGFAAATVDAIVARAGVARGTYYLYYPDKEALLAALLARFAEPLVSAVGEACRALEQGGEPFPIYAVLGAALAELIRQEPDGARLLLQESRARGVGGELARRVTATLHGLTRQILDDAVARGLLRPHDSHAVGLAIAGGIERLAQAWLDPAPGEAPLQPEAVTVELIGLFTWGLAAGRG